MTAGVVCLIVADLSALEMDKPGQDGLTLVDMARGVTVEELRAKTGAQLTVSPDLATARACI